MAKIGPAFFPSENFHDSYIDLIYTTPTVPYTFNDYILENYNK